MDTGADEGVVTEGYPNFYSVSSDTSWRVLPYTPSGSILDVGSTAYNPSGQLSSYTAYRPLTKATAAGSSVATSIGPDFGLLDNGRYATLGGLSPSSQVYTPYNTPATNSAAEGYTGGPVSHRSFENGMLVNILGSQGTSDRSQWRYSQPVYCKTYTETIRPDSPGLMSTAVRYIYRGESTRYSLNYGNTLSYARPREADASLDITFTTAGAFVFTPWQAPVVPDAAQYEWLSNGVSIPNATSSTYSPVLDLVGTRISCKITTRNGNVVESKSYVARAGYIFYMSEPVYNADFVIYRKASGEVTSVPGPTPDITANVTRDYFSFTKLQSDLLGGLPWDYAVVQLINSVKLNTYKADIYTSTPTFGDLYDLIVGVDLYDSVTQRATYLSPIFRVNALGPKQSAYRFMCNLVSVYDRDSGQFREYSSVVEP